MKVLMITPSYSPIIGGTERVVQNLTFKLNELGICTDILTLNMNQKWRPLWKEEIHSSDFKLFRVPAINVFQNIKFNPLAFSFGLHIIPKLDFTKYFKSYDILHFHDDVDLSFPFFSSFVKKPKVFQCHTIVGNYKFYKTRFLSREVLRKVADIYVCVSSESKKCLSALGIPSSKISIIHNGVDPEKFKPNKASKIDNVILQVGRIERQKGLHVLLKSLKYLETPVILKVVGPKSDYRYIHELMGSNNILKVGNHTVELLGSVNDQESLIKLYQQASMLVTPSLVEDFPVVNLEALSCETPVIASMVGGVGDAIENDFNGLLVPPNDPERLAAAIQKLLQNKQLRTKFGENGRKVVEEKFSWDSIAKELITKYEEIC